MFGGYSTEIWHTGILHTPIESVLRADALHDTAITWLPAQPAFCFLADPFGLWHGERLHILAEHYDYRDKRGTIRYFSYDRDFNLVDDGAALTAPHHLSYPFLIQDGADTYMLPEAHQSGALSLYRARAFPRGWEKVCDVMKGPIVDASIIKHQNRWWMFYALEGPDKRAMRELHLASAAQLTGPWTAHAQNPVLKGLETSRPGGTPFVHEGALYLPVQDCRDTYGAAITLLHVENLEWESKVSFTTPAARKILPTDLRAPHTDGLHTLSACSNVTLFDVKRIEHSNKRLWINLQRRWRRLTQ